MDLAVTIIHIIASAALIIIVLLQQGKGASMGAAFGGSSQTVFGSSGATPFLGKVTTIVAVIFMVSSLVLAFFSGPMRGGGSVVGQDAAPASQEAPAQPGGQPVQSAPAQQEAPKQ